MRQSQFIVRRLQCLLSLLCAILRAWPKMRLHMTVSRYCCLLLQTRTLDSQFSSPRIISLIICFSHRNLGPISEIPNDLWNFGMRLSILYSTQPNRLKIGSNVTDRPTACRPNIWERQKSHKSILRWPEDFWEAQVSLSSKACEDCWPWRGSISTFWLMIHPSGEIKDLKIRQCGSHYAARLISYSLDEVSRAANITATQYNRCAWSRELLLLQTSLFWLCLYRDDRWSHFYGTIDLDIEVIRFHALKIHRQRR